MTVKLRARARPTRVRPLAVVIAALALASAARRAAAHPEFSALGANRFVTAALYDGRVDVTDALLEGTLASGEERRRLDADGDGRISDAELRAGEERLRGEGPAVSVEVDGRALAGPLSVAIDLGDEPRANTAPVVVERRSSFPGAWSASARRLRLAIAREPAHLLDTELGLVLGPGLTLSPGTEDRVTFRGPRASSLEDRAALFEVVGPPPATHGKLVLAAIGIGAVVAGVAVFALRRRRARRRQI